jgi:pilus assembly protein CpaF
MAKGKVILLCGEKSMTNLAQELARVMDRPQEVLLMNIQSGEPHSDPALWVSRFQSLAPQMLRNYLTSSEEPWGCLALSRMPSKALAADLFRLLAHAYQWVFVQSPTTLAEESHALLEASDGVFWFKNKNVSRESFQSFLDTLTKFHYPHAFVHAMGSVPEGSRVALLEYVQELASRLHRDSPLFRLEGKVTSQKVVDHVKEQVQPELIRAIAEKNGLETQKAKETVEACLAKDKSLPSSPEERGLILERVLQDVLGLGPLDPLMKDPHVSEVMVNGPAQVYVEKKGKLYLTDIHFSSEKQLRTLIDRIVAPVGRRVDESMPLCDARLKDGSRINVVLPPLALDGPLLTIRKFSAQALPLEALAQLGSFDQAMLRFLTQAVQSRKNMIVCGGTGSGKTTLLNALSSAIPDDERIVTIEDAAELKLQKPHVVRLESRSPNAEGQGTIAIRRLVMNALRMRPDRIIVGECRGGEALDMLQAMNTGHEGSMTTLHANSPRDALGRLETLVLMAGMDLPMRVVREQMRSAIHLILQQARSSDGSRKVISITEVTGMEGDVITTQELFHFRGGEFVNTGFAASGRPT